MTLEIKVMGPGDDLDGVLELCIKGLRESPYRTIPIDLDHLRTTISTLADGLWDDKVILLGLDSGVPKAILVGLVNDTHPIFKGYRLVSEIFWFVEPTHRKSLLAIKLLHLYEDWAKRVGAKFVTLAHFNNEVGDRVSNLYRRLGYEHIETSYMKELVN